MIPDNTDVMAEPRYYMVRAMYQSSDEFKVFFDNSVVAVGWSDVDLHGEGSPHAAAARIRRAYYERGDTAPQVVGKKLNEVRRFMQFRAGDRVVVPHWDSICLATVGEESCYVGSGHDHDLDLANQRRVEYLKVEGQRVRISRASLPEALQRRLRVRGTTVADLEDFSDWLKALYEDPDLTWKARVGRSQEEQAHRFKHELLERIQSGHTGLQAGGRGLELLVGELLRLEGYTVKHLGTTTFPQLADADLEATRNDRFSTTQLLVQVKHHIGHTDTWGLEQLQRAREHRPTEYADHILLLVTSASATTELRKAAEESEDVQLITGDALVDWIYDSLPRLGHDTRVRLGITQVPGMV